MLCQFSKYSNFLEAHSFFLNKIKLILYQQIRKLHNPTDQYNQISILDDHSHGKNKAQTVRQLFQGAGSHTKTS